MIDGVNVSHARPADTAVTVQELAQLVARLEPRAGAAICVAPAESRTSTRPVTARTIRYLGASGVLGRCVHDATLRGDTRLYGPSDLVRLRLFVRMRARGLPAWTAKAALLYLRDDLDASLPSGGHVVFEVSAGRARLIAADQRSATASFAASIRELVRSSETAIAEWRATHPEVWSSWRWITTTDVAALRPTA